MSKLYTRAFRAEAEEGDDGPMVFVASSGGEKRDGEDLDQDKWLLDAYRSNPVWLLNHDYTMSNTGGRPTARAGKIWRGEDGNLRASPEWNEGHPMTEGLRADYRAGFLNTISVGWRDTKSGYDLLDISFVAVPGDQDALLERTRAWLGEENHEEAEDTETEAETPRDDWEKTAERMVGLFQCDPNDDDEARIREYRALMPAYSRLKRTPPTFMLAEDVLALGSSEWRGLFFEGEADEDAATVYDLARAFMQVMERGTDRAWASDVIARLTDDDAPEPIAEDDDTLRLMHAAIMEG